MRPPPIPNTACFAIVAEQADGEIVLSALAEGRVIEHNMASINGCSCSEVRVLGPAEGLVQVYDDNWAGAVRQLFSAWNGQPGVPWAGPAPEPAHLTRPRPELGP